MLKWRTAKVLTTRAALLRTSRISTLSRIAVALLILLLLPGLSGCTSRTDAPPAASPRLHLVAVLYGKYISAHKGEMPADQADLISYVNAHEREVLQRRGFRSADDIFTVAERQPELIVLYRDARERLQTEYVAIEEQSPTQKRVADKSGKRDRSRSKWFAADALGVVRVIGDDESSRILAETPEIAGVEKESAAKEAVEKQTRSEPQDGKAS